MQADLPGDLNGWVTLVVVLASTAISWGLAIWRASAYKLGIDRNFEKQGERIGRAEQTGTALNAEIAHVQKKTQTAEFNIMSLTEGQGEQRARFDSLMKRLESQDERKREQETEVTDRLARIETQLNIFIGLYSERRD